MSFSGAQLNNHFTIIIPSYNNERWVEKCLGSALRQDYNNYDVIFINDCSTDSTLVSARKVIENTPTKSKVRLVNNDINRKALYNLYHHISASRDGTIIVTLDGDDWFPNNQALNFLNETYSDSDVWITAGSYIDNVAAIISSPNLTPGYWKGNIRTKLWTISHLRTFRKELFMKIRYEDLLDIDNYFYKFTFDQAMMYPMAEMAGPRHFREIKEVLYVYNRRNPISVDRVHRHDQLRIEQQIRRKNPYCELENLDV